jgi:hypothetical protein
VVFDHALGRRFGLELDDFLAARDRHLHVLRDQHLAQPDALGGRHLALDDADLLFGARHALRGHIGRVAVSSLAVVVEDGGFLVGRQGGVRVEVGRACRPGISRRGR